MEHFAVEVESLCHRYGDRLALDEVNFSVPQGEIFGLIGPNGGGKSTTFRVLATLTIPTSGRVKIFGVDILKSPQRVRSQLGVVFQFPGLDKKLTVMENLRHQGHLYGLRRRDSEVRAKGLLERLGLADRGGELVEKLSGGLKRRCEIAKSLLHRPKLLILDEPTTGLDPLARREVWEHLRQLHKQDGLTVLVTTHLLEEADACQRVALLDRGKVVASDSPAKLKETLGGDVITVRSNSPARLREAISREFSLEVQVVDTELRIERRDGHEFIPRLVAAFPNDIESVTLGKPTLEDFFIQRTGRKFWSEEVRV